MNILGYLLISWATLGTGHKLIKKPLEELVGVDSENLTPAHLHNDGVDYVPTNKFILLGHHWMSIAGTTAIVASVIGLVWGWIPSLIWMLVGVHFLGATNDYFGLMLSVKHKGKSLGQIASTVIDAKTGKMLSSLYLMSSLLVAAMLMGVIANTMAAFPEAAIPVLMLIPLAMLFGILTRKGIPLIPLSVLFSIVIIGSCILGASYPVFLSYRTWIMVFMIYTLGAMTLPVWLLLSPRDYLNTLLVVGGMMLGALSLLLFRPDIQMPAFAGFTSVRGSLWPMIMATITCGAASGVHSLICFGTTARQLNNEKDGFLVAFGGMQGETFIAGISAAMIMVVFSYEQFLERAYVNAGAAFSEAMGQVISMLGIHPVWATTIGTLIFGALLLTTLDSWARAGRYVMQELASDKSLISSNIWFSSIIYLLIAFVMMIMVPYMQIWSGIAIGSLTLLAVPLTLLLIKRYDEGKAIDMKFTLFVSIPLLFVYPSAIVALGYQIIEFIGDRNWTALAMNLYMSYVMGSLLFYSVKKLLLIRSAKYKEADVLKKEYQN